MTDPAGSGVDLARMALAAAKATARKQGATAAKDRPRRLVSVKRGTVGGGREPLSLGAALGQVVADRGWQLEAKAGTIADRWPDLVPVDLAAVAFPEHYDAERRTLHLRPATRTAASLLKMSVTTLTAQLNTRLGEDLVHRIEVLPVDAGRTRSAAAPPVADNPFADGPRRPTPPPPARSPELEAIWARAREIKAEKDAAAAARSAELRAPHAHHCPTLREPESAFLEATRARQDAEEDAARSADSHQRALAVARERRRNPAAAPSAPAAAVRRAS